MEEQKIMTMEQNWPCGSECVNGPHTSGEAEPSATFLVTLANSRFSEI
jgi:hypothetical protein